MISRLSKNILPLGIGLLAIGYLVFGIFALWQPAKANPLGFSCPAYGPGGVASTSIAYMTPGTATSTLLYDTYCVGGTNQPNTGNTNTTNSLALLTQLTASSTSSVLNMAVEYSQDGVDWYQDDNIFATTTNTNIQSPNSLTWPYAVSNVGGVPNTGNRLGKVVRIYTPTRYVRVVYTITGANAGVWGELLPQKEVPNE